MTHHSRGFEGERKEKKRKEKKFAEMSFIYWLWAQQLLFIAWLFLLSK